MSEIEKSLPEKSLCAHAHSKELAQTLMQPEGLSSLAASWGKDQVQNIISKDGSLHLGDPSSLYVPGSPIDKMGIDFTKRPGHPFSPLDIMDSGRHTAELLLKHDANSSFTNFNILQYENNSQIRNDVRGYVEAWAAGGIQQATLGDCWFQSTVASLVNRHDGPQRFSDMIRSNEDGGYTVTFPGDKEHPIKLSQDDVDKNPRISDSAEWNRVMEAAVLKHDFVKAAATEDGGKGAYATDAFKLLTGQDAQVQKMDISTAELAVKLESLMKSGKPVVAEIIKNPLVPLESCHDYSVVGYNPVSNMITLRNPFGRSYVPPGLLENGVIVQGAGVVSLPLETFKKNALDITYLS
jgi:hypothetical protein